jgi:hypothetical protein
MAQLMVRGLMSAEVAQVRAIARATGVSTGDAGLTLIREALSARRGRAKGSEALASINAARTPDERSAAARKAAVARWAQREG